MGLLFPFQFQNIKEDAEKIPRKNFRPYAVEHFRNLYLVLQKHGIHDNVWSTFSFFLECHNHLNNAKTGRNNVSRFFVVVVKLKWNVLKHSR